MLIDEAKELLSFVLKIQCPSSSFIVSHQPVYSEEINVTCVSFAITTRLPRFSCSS